MFLLHFCISWSNNLIKSDIHASMVFQKLHSINEYVHDCHSICLVNLMWSGIFCITYMWTHLLHILCAFAFYRYAEIWCDIHVVHSCPTCGRWHGADPVPSHKQRLYRLNCDTLFGYPAPRQYKMLGNRASSSLSWQWRHNEHDGVSNHQPHDCLLKRIFRRRSKKTSKFRVTGLCEGN